MLDETWSLVKESAAEFGATADVDYVERDNRSDDAWRRGEAYFGLIHPLEEKSGPYHDLSFVLSLAQSDTDCWVVSLCLGTQGFRNDLDLASRPGLRREFQRVVSPDGVCKANFTDPNLSLPKRFKQNAAHLRGVTGKYSKLLLACDLVDPRSKSGRDRILGYLAAYARGRGWPSNARQRKSVQNAIDKVLVDAHAAEQEVSDALELLKERKFIVLEGPPGTGKTRLAERLVSEMAAKAVFTQFHASTSYSDFVYGVRPVLRQSAHSDSDSLTPTDSGELGYEARHGPMLNAIRLAQNSEGHKPVILLIDEINRANLASVLGESLYLFEYRRDSTDVEVTIGDISLSALPENLYVIGTMNTADRSLAVVDFALRRRFAWLPMRPRPLTEHDTLADGLAFYQNDYDEIARVFYWYAEPDELPLQPGQGYFIARSDDEMKRRLRFEILPLVREYLREGVLASATDEFADFFLRRINQRLFD